MKKVAVIMGSDSDFPVVSKAVAELKAYGVPYECHVMSAHRTPALARVLTSTAWTLCLLPFRCLVVSL